MRGKPAYPWYVAAATFVVLVVAAGRASATTTFIQPLEREFGWTAATISVAIAIALGLLGFMAPFAAALMNRYGVRRTVGAGLALLGFASMVSVRMTQPWQLDLLWGVVSGLGVGTIGLALSATIATRWFEAQRGLVMGAFAAANATGQLIFLPVFAHIIATSGWRTCALVLGAACLALVPLFLVVVRERPADVGLPKYGATTIEPAPPRAGNAIGAALGALREGARKRDFWLLAGSFFVCGASTNGLIGTHLIPACGDHGIPETRAAGLLAAMGAFDLLGTTASGWLSDRYDGRILLAWYYGLRGLSLLFLPLAFGWQTLGLPAFAVFYGLDWIATVPPTLKLANTSFGVARGPVIFAWIFASHQLGASAIAYLAGLARTGLGSYDVAFTSAGALCLCAATMVLFIARGRASVGAAATA